MRFLLFLVTIFLSFISSLYSQNPNIEEYLVTESQDTLYGIIHPTSEIVHIDQGLYFRSDKNSPVSLYRINEITAYKNNLGKLFYKKLVPRSGKDSIYQLVEILFRGNLNLYQLNSNFYIEKEKKIYQLKDTDSEIRNNEGRLVLRHNKEYLSTLSVLLSDCYSLYDKIMNSNLEYNSLITLLEKYHECINSDYFIVRDASEFRMSYNIGFNLGGFTTSASQRLLTNERNEVSGLSDQNLMFGIDLYIRFHKQSNIYMIVSPQFSFNNQYSHQNSRIANDYWLYNYDLNYQFNLIDFPVGIGFTFNNEKIQPFLNASFVLSRIWDGSYDYTISRGPKSDGGENQSLLADFNQEFTGVNNIGLSTSFGINYRFNKRITFFNKFRYQASNFFIEQDRIQAAERFFNYQQFKIEFGILF